MPEEKNDITEINNATALKGKYSSACGRRKTAVARVRLYKKGNGLILVNGVKMNEYFQPDHLSILRQPLKATEHLRDYNVSILVKGGGKKTQAEAVRHGLARALSVTEENAKPVLKAKGWLTRDPRKKERKKPGLKKARRAPQWAKR